MKAKSKENSKEFRKTNKATQPTTQQPQWHRMNRKQRRELARSIQSEEISLEMVHPDAAGIDIGNDMHYVCVPANRDSEPVRHFGCTTAELKAMADWLKQCRIRTVAMQSTGVYWIAVFDILEEAGFEVYLVNARHEESAGPQKRRARESMADEVAHLWSVTQFLPAGARNPTATDLLAAAE